jgi:tRNA A-37 threonylcarbamoyl transferase component Bud32/tetratricopeptide (TPR) repeat protein
LPEHTINKMICPQCHTEWPGDFVTCAEDGQPLKSIQDDPLIGQTFADRYQIVSVLGLGGMSVVYKAKHKLMDRMVAIKLMHAGLVKEPMALQRFQQESKAAASISHQNVVTVYDFGITADGQAFFVMDCLEGPTLGDVIEKIGHLPVERAVNIFRQVCDGLECAHKKGVIHRDLKPANLVLLTQEDGSELVKIVDFGIAKFLPTSGKKGQSLTQVGEVFGSPLFMSPEQLQARAVDARSDIYALGCVMYETLTGVLAVLGDNVVETMNMHLSQKPKSFKEVAPSLKIPEEVEAIVFKCLEKSPSDRFQSAADVARALPDYGYVPASQGGAITGNMSGRTAKSPRQFITINLKTDSKVLTWVSGVFAGILALVLAFLFFWQGPTDDHGAIINKIAWQFALSASDVAYGQQNYEMAAKCTEYAASLAEKFVDGHTRLLETLNTEAKIYRAANRYAELKNVNDRISVVRNQKVLADFDKVMVYLDGLVSSKDALRIRMNAVDAEASIDKVIRGSDELGATDMFAKQEILLRRCRQVFEKLGVHDGEIQARLNWALADCLFRQQKTLEIRALLVEALELSKKLGSKSPGFVVRSLLKLGIFDKDQNDFPKTKLELEEAVALSKKQSDKQLRSDCLSAYADYFHQLHQDDKAKVLYEEAAKLAQS